MSDKLRALVISHGHPTHSLGGAEIASHGLHKALNGLPGIESIYLARVGNPVPRHGASALMSLRLAMDEVLYHAEDFDHFFLSNGDTDAIRRDLLRFVGDIKPDIVHFHHIIGFGLEALFAVRDALPKARIVVTFHEYLPICHNHGQMVKRPSGQLCNGASPISCHTCFPEIPVSRFVRREQFVRGMLNLADAFIAPSAFLANRYVEWGIAAEKIFVIENGIVMGEKTPARELPAPTARRNRFAYFGQMTPFKGVHVLIDAVSRVPEDVWGDDSTLMIFGGNLERQPTEYQDRVAKLIEDAGRRVRFYGAYQNQDMPRLMRSVDWVVMPSVWWENSPIVIQEALHHGRPILCSDIGGMAEKVRDRLDGYHFRAGSAQDLADRLIDVLSTPRSWENLRATLRRPMSHVDCGREHVALYRKLLKEEQPAHPSSAVA